MANLLSRFNQAVAGSNSKLADYQATVASYGDFRRIKDIEVILSSWNNILITPKRSYQFDPEYGSDIYKLIFEPADEETLERVRAEVIETLLRYDDRALIENININILPNRKGYNIAVDVRYEGQTGQLEVVIDEDSYFKFFDSTTET
jgi:phage baseplate assembly protein W